MTTTTLDGASSEEAQPRSITEAEERTRIEQELHVLEERVFDALYPPDRESGLVAHARRELQRAGLFDSDSDYGGAIGTGLMRIMRAISSEGWSGGAASIAVPALTALLQYRTLTPNDHSDYQDVSEMANLPPGTMLQDSRDPRWFSKDGGKTWYDVEEAQRRHNESLVSDG